MMFSQDLARKEPHDLAGSSAILRKSSITPFLGGYGAKLLFDERLVTCLFDSYDSGKSFLRFCELYVSDAQPGNSYGGFSPASCELDSEPYRVLFPRRKYFEIWQSTVSRMFHAICAKRLMIHPEAGWKDPENTYEALRHKWESAQPEVEVNNGYTNFSFDESKLPHRVQPAKLGEFLFVVDDPHFRREDAYFITDLNGKALIALIHFPNPPKAEDLVLVDRAHLMCAHDFYPERESQRKEALIRYALERLRENGISPNPELPKTSALFEA